MINSSYTIYDITHTDATTTFSETTQVESTTSAIATSHGPSTTGTFNVTQVSDITSPSTHTTSSG